MQAEQHSQAQEVQSQTTPGFKGPATHLLTSASAPPSFEAAVLNQRGKVEKSAHEVAAELGISPRIYRERRATVEALTTVGWQMERQMHSKDAAD